MAEVPSYVEGDTIRVELVFRHGAHITEIRAGFFADLGGVKPIVLRDYGPEVLGSSGLVKEYRAIVEGVVEQGHVYGSYHCGHVIATTAGGRERTLAGREALPDIRFEVLEEPSDFLSISSHRFV